MGACVSVNTIKSNNIVKLENIKLAELKPHYGKIESQLEQKLKLCTLENTPKKQYNFMLAKIIKVYDGDTYTIAYNDTNGVKEEFFQNRIRLYGVNCYELKDDNVNNRKKAIEAREFVKSLILNNIVDVEILNGKKLNGKTINEKYGRLIGKISYKGQDIATLLLEKGLAVKFMV